MTPEQLLKKRYMVMFDWPGNNCFLPGEIILEDDHRLNNTPLWVNLRFSQMPHLFKKLEWWEERNPEDFPDFVVYKWSEKAKPLIVKIEKLFTDSNGRSNNYGFVDQLGEYRAFSRTTPLPETPAS